MDNTIRYLNTDLDLVSPEDLAALAGAFEAQWGPPPFVRRDDEGQWYTTFETNEQHDEPEATIASMITVVESLPDQMQVAWSQCTRREFNIGYACGSQPWGFTQALSHELLKRIASVGASLGITLYPHDGA